MQMHSHTWWVGGLPAADGADGLDCKSALGGSAGRCSSFTRPSSPPAATIAELHVWKQSVLSELQHISTLNPGSIPALQVQVLNIASRFFALCPGGRGSTIRHDTPSHSRKLPVGRTRQLPQNVRNVLVQADVPAQRQQHAAQRLQRARCNDSFCV